MTDENSAVVAADGGNKPSGNDNSGQHLLSQGEASGYWRENILLLIKLLVVWFIVSFGFGILLVEQLNQYSLLGMQLGFWFAQQGSIYVFIVLIFTYVVRIKKIEQRYGVDDSAELSSADEHQEKSL